VADQTIEIRLVLRDELSRQLAPINAQLRQLANTRVDAAHAGFQRLAPAVRVVHRELSTLSRLTLGGLVGGGVVAGIATAVRAMQDMARQQIQLHYTAQQLGVSTKFIENYRDALTGLGEAPEAATSAIKQALSTLDDFYVKGEKSSFGAFLEKSIAGPDIARRLRAVIKNQGEEAGLEFLISVGNKIKDRRGQAEFFKQAGLPFSAKDVAEILPLLGKRVQLSTEQMKALAIANMQYERSSRNIGLILGSELTPAVTKVMKALDDYLRTESGKKFAKQIGDIAKQVSDAISDWITKGGLEKTLDTLTGAFQQADAVIQAMNLSWPKVIAGLALGKFALSLLGVANGIKTAMKLLLPLTPFILAWEDIKKHLGKTPEDLKKEIDEATKKHVEEGKPTTIPEYLKQQGVWDWIYKQLWPKKEEVPLPQPKPQSGEGKPQNEQERRAAQAADERERDALNRELEQLAIGTGHLADYLGQTAIGGPEGGFGASGYQLDGGDKLGGDLSRAAYDTMFRQGPMAGQYDAVVAAAAQQDVSPSLLAGIMALESKAPQGGPFGMSRATMAYLNPGGLMGGGRGNTKFMNFPTIGAGIEKTAAVVAKNITRGGGTFEGLAEQYSPSTDPRTGRPYPNDPGGTNRLWPSLVSKFTSQLTERGFDPGGLQGAEPGGGGVSSITRLLAQESGALSGSATVDIDVGGLASGARNPSALFKPQPMDGAVQMQNAHHVPDNRLSFQ